MYGNMLKTVKTIDMSLNVDICYYKTFYVAVFHPYRVALGGGCSQRLCECDQQLALCLKRYGCPKQKALCKTSPWRWFQNVLF